jgi:hypothetical protein
VGIDKNTVLVRYLYLEAYSMLYLIQWESGTVTGPKLNNRNASRSVENLGDGTVPLSHCIEYNTEYV